MIYVYAYNSAAGKHCIMRARCRHCFRSRFPHGTQDEPGYFFVFGFCVYPDGHKKDVVRNQLACDRFYPKSSIRIVKKEADQLSLFN